MEKTPSYKELTEFILPAGQERLLLQKGFKAEESEEEGALESD